LKQYLGNIMLDYMKSFRLRIVLAALLSVGIINALDFDQASVIIQNHVKSFSYNTQKNMCDFYNCCTISETESCELSELEADRTNLVYPGGETRCIFSDSTPYSFQVIPGDTDKLLVYFQGGGACWSEETTKLSFCTTDAKPGPLTGIFDRKNPDNLYRDYTIVQLLYCSGDVW
jgi:hypothetical protein